MKKFLICTLFFAAPTWCIITYDENIEKQVFATEDNAVNNSKIIATHLHINHIITNNGMLQAEHIEISKDLEQGGTINAHSIFIDRSCTIFACDRVSAQHVFVKGSTTALKIPPLSTTIETLHKNDKYMGKIVCETMGYSLRWLSHYGTLKAYNKKPDRKKSDCEKIVLTAPVAELAEILSTGITRAKSVEEFMEYLQENYAHRIPDESMRGSWAWTPIIQYLWPESTEKKENT